MDLVLEQYNAADHTATYASNRAASIDFKPQFTPAGTSVNFSGPDGKTVGSLLKLDLDQRANRATAVVRLDDAETANLTAAGCLSSLALPERRADAPYLCDIPQSPGTTFKYVKSPNELPLQKSFAPVGIMNKRRQQALTEVYKARSSSSDSLQSWRQGRLLRELQQPTTPQSPNRNAAHILSQGLVDAIRTGVADRQAREPKQSNPFPQAATDRTI